MNGAAGDFPTPQRLLEVTKAAALPAWIALVLTFLAGPVGFLPYVVARGVLRRTCAVDPPHEASIASPPSRCS